MAKDAEKLDAQAQRIRELRKFARVSQEIVAGAVGVTLRAYQRWERGEGEINPDNIKKLAGYFSTTPDYIEYGVMEREREATPDLGANGSLDRRLARLESKIDQLLEVSAERSDGQLTAQQLAEMDQTRAHLERLVERMEAQLRQPNGVPKATRSAAARRSQRARNKPAA